MRTAARCALVAVRSHALTSALAACLFALVVGAKWATFDRYGSPMPDWDQWDAEAMELLVPWFTGDDFLQHLLHPHNEHRVVLTKLQSLALVLLNGQWDSRLEAVTNALLHAALAIGFWLLARRHTAGRWHAPLFMLIAALFALPLAWQNVLGGFHSQQYWLLALSFAAVVTLVVAPTGSARWWLGLVSAILALGAMASGLLAAAVVALVLLLRWWRRETRLREIAPTLAVAVGTAAVGLWTRVDFIHHAPMRAGSFGEFAWSVIRSLQWPLRQVDIGAVLMWAPFALLAREVLRRGPADRGGWRLLALGAWVLLQVAATAYARGAGAEYPASRYMDTLQFGTIVNALAFAWLAGRPASARHRRGLAVLGGLWLGGLAFGSGQNLTQALHWDLPQAKNYYGQAEPALRRFLLNGDRAELELVDLPYPDPEELQARLKHPVLNALLPVPLRAPLPLAPSSPAPLRRDAPFLENALPPWGEIAPLQHGLSFDTPALDHAPTWGSFALGGVAAQGEWRSAPLPPPRFPWLKFETAGHVGEPGVSLELRAARTDALLATVAPTRVPRDSWRAAYVRAPRVPFVVVARDHDPARWMAFSPPVEMGGLSYVAWQLAKNGLLVLYCAAALSVALGLLGWRNALAPRRPLAAQRPDGAGVGQ